MGIFGCFLPVYTQKYRHKKYDAKMGKIMNIYFVSVFSKSILSYESWCHFWRELNRRVKNFFWIDINVRFSTLFEDGINQAQRLYQDQAQVPLNVWK